MFGRKWPPVPSRLALVIVLFTPIFVANSYICDDAFIHFRTVDNCVRGYGLRWNVLERVQVFTGPLYTLLLSCLYYPFHDPSFIPNPTRIYLVAMSLSYGLSALTICIVAQSLRHRAVFMLALSLLFAS